MINATADGATCASPHLYLRANTLQLKYLQHSRDSSIKYDALAARLPLQSYICIEPHGRRIAAMIRKSQFRSTCVPFEWKWSSLIERISGRRSRISKSHTAIGEKIYRERFFPQRRKPLAVPLAAEGAKNFGRAEVARAATGNVISRFRWERAVWRARAHRRDVSRNDRM